MNDGFIPGIIIGFFCCVALVLIAGSTGNSLTVKREYLREKVPIKMDGVYKQYSAVRIFR